MRPRITTIRGCHDKAGFQLRNIPEIAAPRTVCDCQLVASINVRKK
jgi:hypothetical protein